MGCLKLTTRDFLKLHNCSKKNAISRFFHTVSDDQIGNRLSATTNKNEILLAYNDLNQITSATPAKVDVLSKLAGDYQYDTFGNLISTPKANYRYNLNNRLLEVNQKDSKLTFAYDPNGRRIYKKVYNKKGDIVTHTKFLYSAFKCVAEIDALTNKVTKLNEWNGEQLLGVYNPEKDKALSILTDGNKNVIGLMGTDSEISAKFAYSPFGKLLTTPKNGQGSQGADVADCSFGFSSEYFDKETGLVYYNYRYLNTVLGKWMSRDRIEERGGYNLYAMVFNSPLNYIDIKGLSSVTLTAVHKGTGHASVERRPSIWEAYIWEQGPGADWDVTERYASVHSKLTTTSTSASISQFGHTEMPYSSYKELQMSHGVNIYLTVKNNSCDSCEINITSNENAVSSGSPSAGHRTLAEYTGPDSVHLAKGESANIGQLIVGFGWLHLSTDASNLVSAIANASVTVSCSE